jgi:DNA replication initiation complex subunit (GINS family)
MHSISSRQDAMLRELHEVTTRIEKLSQAEHDLISDVHPQVSEIKEHVQNVREVVSPEKSWSHVETESILSNVQLRITRVAQKAIKIARSQSRLRAIGTKGLNSSLWRTEIFL